MTKSLADEDLQITTEEEYRALLRSLRRRKGFGIFFVQCTPVGGQELIAKVESDLPQKNIDVLELDEPIDNLIELVEALPNQEQLNILFIVGLEKSLVDYIRPGYGGVGDYYKLDTVPPILNHLNWQRENFRDRFRHLCFVFLLPSFAVKYILHRAPDFADWRSGMVDVPTDRQLIEQETTRLWMDSSFEKYRQWTEHQRLERIAEIQTYLAENSDPERIADLWCEQGKILVFNEEYEAAVSSFDKAIQARPNQPIKLNPLSHFFQRLLRRKVTSMKGFEEAWYGRGYALRNLGLDEEALASYEQAVEIQPDYYTAWYNRGNTLGTLGRYEEALASYDKALAIKPDYDLAWFGRGYALDALGRLEGALASYDKALEINPDDDSAWYNRGNALNNLGRHEEAITSYDKALEINPDNDSAWHNRGMSLKNLGRHEEALLCFEQVLKIKPDDDLAWYNMACTYAVQNQIDLAIENLEKAILLDKKYVKMAMEDSDFDSIRQDYRFQKLIGQSL